MGRGFQLTVRAVSPSSVLECNSSMAFRDDAWTLRLMILDPGSLSSMQVRYLMIKQELED